MENDIRNKKSAQGAFSNETAPPDYNDGKWHGWIGGECPVHRESIVSVMFPDGNVIEGGRAGRWEWGHNIEPDLRIMALKVTTPHVEPKDPREFWLYKDPEINYYSVKETPPHQDWGEVIHVREVLE